MIISEITKGANNNYIGVFKRSKKRTATFLSTNKYVINFVHMREMLLFYKKYNIIKENI